MFKRRGLLKKEKIDTPCMDMFIERIKKIRALNCNPLDVGMDNFVLWKLISDRPNNSSKFR
ncbi:MAG: hypothetical protein A2987_00095 [Omnitrophica bacterium RIFCSPLOWO2_01_FULL_45_10]|nr:MAG: hypothetical protein A2987_00095 [Omnitrophica bacterium RIFCSPLOWO2_01_FULL_45_10]